MSAKMYRYEVTHPEFGTVVVNAISEATAVQAALKYWGEDWRLEAGYCHARKLGTAAKPRCRRCHREFGEPGDTTAYCPECLRIMDQNRREAVRFSPARKRPGYEE